MHVLSDSVGAPGLGPGAPTPLLAVTALSKRYGAIQAIDAIDLSIAPGEIHALVGHNGAGKSTLVKALAGLVAPDGGEIRIDGAPLPPRGAQAAQRQGIALVDQELSLVPVLTVEDNILLGAFDAPLLARRRASRARVRELLDRVGLEHVAPTTPVAALTLGERQLVEIARGLGRSARLLILDEPTATLSDAEIEHVFRSVRAVAARGAGVLFVSHRLGEVLDLCHRATVLRDGRLVATEPIAALDRDRLIELMLGQRPAPPLALTDRHAPGAARLEVRGLALAPRLAGIDLDVRGGEVMALAGQVGSGASDVLRAIAGLAPEARGSVRIDGRPLRLASPQRALRAGAVYLPDDRQQDGLFGSHTVERNLLATRLGSLSRAGVIQRRAARRAAGELADTVGVRPRLAAPVRELSGGNQQKVLLGRSLRLQRLKVLLLDEPTRGVDVGGRAEIHALIRDAARAGATVLFTSTELDEVLDLADAVTTLYAGRIVRVRPRDEVSAGSILADMTHAEGAA